MRLYKCKVCIIAPVHLYSDTRVFQKEAKTLQKNGYIVRLFARHTKDAYIDEIEIKAVPKIKVKLLRFFSHPWILWEVLKYNPQIIHLHNPDTLLIGFILKLLKKKVIYDVHEDFTKRVPTREWIPSICKKPLVKLVKWGEKLAYHFFDRIIITQQDLIERIGDNCLIIENSPVSTGDLIQKAYLLSNNIIKEKYFRAIYIGSINRIRGLFEMIESIKCLNENYELKSRLWLAGVIEEALLKDAQKKSGWEYVDYLGNLSQEEAFSYVIKSDVGFNVIKNEGGYDSNNPNKLFEYQLFGIPFIASDFEYWKQTITTTKQTGIFVNPENIEEITKAAYELAINNKKAKKLGENGRNFIISHYNWEIESKKLLDLYCDLKQIASMQNNNHDFNMKH
jgi:glycosyltransferase involved in cell wall biosynthesis